MAAVMELIERERLKSGISAEKFANEIGVTSTTYSRQSNGRQALGIDSIQAYARYARKVGNVDILRALGAYVLGLNPDEIIINPSPK
jgi:transcriptional regulator with XRE-family HTH domain